MKEEEFFLDFGTLLVSTVKCVTHTYKDLGTARGSLTCDSFFSSFSFLSLVPERKRKRTEGMSVIFSHQHKTVLPAKKKKKKKRIQGGNVTSTTKPAGLAWFSLNSTGFLVVVVCFRLPSSFYFVFKGLLTPNRGSPVLSFLLPVQNRRIGPRIHKWLGSSKKRLYNRQSWSFFFFCLFLARYLSKSDTNGCALLAASFFICRDCVLCEAPL